MKFNNNLKNMSTGAVVFMAILCILLTVFVVWFYFSNSIQQYSLANFCNWYVDMFHAFQADAQDEPWIPWIIMVGIPVLCYGGLVISIKTAIKERKDFARALNLESVDFATGKVYFNFNKPQYNFVCGYNDINKIEMDLNTVMVHGKYSSYPALSKIVLNFTVLNNKRFSLTSNLNGYMKKIYSIIDYGKFVKNFSYKFSGVGKVDSIDEKIRDYMTTGCKQILATQTENSFKWLSILFFMIGIFFLYSFRDIFNDSDISTIGFVCIPFLGFFVVSFVFDIFLLADKWHENKYKRF